MDFSPDCVSQAENVSTLCEPLVLTVQHDDCGGVVSAVVTISETLVVRVTPPLVPFTIRLYVPVGVELAVLIVTVDDPEPVTEDGEKLAVAPEGRPLTVNVTESLEVESDVTATVKLPEPP